MALEPQAGVCVCDEMKPRLGSDVCSTDVVLRDETIYIVKLLQ